MRAANVPLITHLLNYSVKHRYNAGSDRTVEVGGVVAGGSPMVTLTYRESTTYSATEHVVYSLRRRDTPTKD